MSVGGCTLEVVEAVCDLDGTLPHDVLERVAALLDQSLLRRTDAIAGEPRVMMLETIREYALEQLSARGEPVALRRRHAAYYLALAETAEPAPSTASPKARREWGGKRRAYCRRRATRHQFGCWYREGLP